METQRYEDGKNWARQADYSSPEIRYDIKVEPMLRRLADGWVTRNRYGAECLNSPILFAADIDFCTDDNKIACRDIVRELFRYQYMSSAITIEPLRMVEARLREVLADPIGRALGFRLYESHNGFRVVCSSAVFGLRTDNEKDVAGHLQERLFCDRAYRYICAEQGLFRLRLTPKPWRSRSGTARAARYIGTYGSDEIDPVLAPLIAEHDRVACVDQLGRADAELA